MIYSVHNPFTGLFEYHEGGPNTPINDDLPTPRFDAKGIGVAASQAGRPLPRGCKKIGQGLLPVGSISSGRPGMWKGNEKGTMPSGMGALGEFDGLASQLGLAALVAGLVVGVVYLLRGQTEADI